MVSHQLVLWKYQQGHVNEVTTDLETDVLPPIKYQVGMRSIATVGPWTCSRSPHLLPPFIFVDGLHFIFGEKTISALAGLV